LPDWNGKIVFLEDVKEEPYRIDRMLMQMKLNGVFDQVNGIILGNFRKCFAEEPEHSFTLEEIFEDYFMNHPVPVFYGAQIGHTLNKFTLPIGADVLMDATNGTIQLIHPAVK
jgi:muramoyltetrapeptide carboxypeptidase